MSAVNLDSIEAGTYVLVAHSWDQITSKPGQPYDYDTRRKGDKVQLGRDEARRLVTAGAVVTEEAYERSQNPSPAQTAVSVLDESGLARLREKLGLDPHADQDAILAALDVREPGTSTPAPPPSWWGDGEQPKTIADIEQAVGNDKALAAAALAAEYAAAAPRTTLIDKLTDVVAGE